MRVLSNYLRSLSVWLNYATSTAQTTAVPDLPVDSGRAMPD